MDSFDLKLTDNKHINAPTEANARYSPKDKEKLAKAAKDFESLMTSMMLKEMTKSTSGGMFGEESFGGDVFDTMFESEMAKYMTSSKNLGVAKMLYKKITGEDLPDVKPVEKVLKNNAGAEQIKTKPISGNSPKVTPSAEAIKRIDRYEDIINDAAKAYGVDANLIKSVIMAESAGNSKAVSSAKAKGLMQLIDSTAADMGVKNVWDPKQNIYGGTKYLSEMLRQYNGDVELALAGYNAGPGNVDKYNGVPPFNETRKYITRVTGYLKHFES
jgi:Rod binding domain-containing protein